MIRWRCLCGDTHQGRPAYERQALPSGLMARACQAYLDGAPTAERIEADTERMVEAESKRGAR